MNRILFLRVCEDRNLECYQTLLKLANAHDFSALINKFQEADKRFNSGLFDQLLNDKIVEDISSVFWTIIKQLYYPESPYSFSVFSSDVLGKIYEIFLSERLAIQDDTVVLIKKPENVDKDVVTTPTFIINNILRNTALLKCNCKSDEEILQLKFSDIACGSGTFLLELYQLLNDILIDYYLNEDRSKLIQTNLSTFKLPFETKRMILLNCIYGIDKDYNAVEATKFGLLLKLLEDEDTNSTLKTKPVLPDLSSNVFYGNSLLTPTQVEDEKLEAINPFDFNELHFDVIVGNPPYMKSEDMKNITPLELPLYKKYYDSAYKQFDKYFLFLERGVELLTDDGILGYIVPSKFEKVGAGMKLRSLIADNGYLSSVVSFGANQVFNDKTTYTCLLILKKNFQDTFKYAEVKDLESWKVREPESIRYAEKQTSELNGDVWVLLTPELTTIYDKIISQSIKLVDLVGDDNIFNGIQTSANNIYIFAPTKEDKKYYYWGDNQIEKTFTKPYFRTSSGSDNLYSYRSFKPNVRVIYPYTKKKEKVELIPLAEIEEKYPFAYKYLQKYKADLDNPKRDIKPTPATKNEWHRYGRHQSLDNCGLPSKIIVGVLSVGDKYAVDTYGTLISSGGTAGYCVVAIPEDSEYSIYYIQAILNSKYLEWFCSLYGEVFRGGYIARGTKVLKNLPIRTIDFSSEKEKMIHDKIVASQKRLIGIHDKMDANVVNKRIWLPLEARFSIEKIKLNDLLAQLYDLGEDDARIPLIKELYV